MAEPLFITSPGEYDGSWAEVSYIEVTASSATIKNYRVIGGYSSFGLQLLGGNLLVDSCILENSFMEINIDGGNLTLKNSVIDSPWPINTVTYYYPERPYPLPCTITAVNNLFLGTAYYYAYSKNSALTFINNTFASTPTYGWDIEGCTLTLKNNIFVSEINPHFTSQIPFKHNPYPNGYFLASDSPAIDAGENEPGNPPYGCLGTTSVDDTPDDVTKSNIIDLGFHYPYFRLEATPIPICFLPIGEMWSPKIQG